MKLIVILGPTASGKTDLSIKLAKKFNGEIVSADSRQVYKGLDIGSGKITKSKMRGITHHLLDVANPKRKFTVSQYQKLALRAIKNIQKRNKIPFLVGGTGFYIKSIVDGIIIPDVKPNWKLRKKLEKKNTAELFLMLKKLDPERAKTIDAKNPRRLIRAIEIVLVTDNPVPLIGRPTSDFQKIGRRASANFEILQIGIKKSPEELKKAIHKRLLKRIKGIIAEVKNLTSSSLRARAFSRERSVAGSNLSFKRLEELGMEYRFVAQYVQDKIHYEEMIEKLQKEIERFAKRQMTWFKRDKRIQWIENQRQTEELIKKFL